MSESDKEEQGFWEANRKWLIAVVGGTLVVAIAFGAIPFVFYTKPQNANEFGDTFGFLNSVMSSFALLGVILTVFMQGYELRLQRKEMRLSQQAMREGAEAQKELVEMQFCQSYLNSLDTLLHARPEKLDAFRNCEHDYGRIKLISELETMISRMGPTVIDIVSNLRIVPTAALEQIENAMSEIEKSIGSNRPDVIQRAARSSLRSVNMLLPGMKKSSSITERYAAQEVETSLIPLLHSLIFKPLEVDGEELQELKHFFSELSFDAECES